MGALRVQVVTGRFGDTILPGTRRLNLDCWKAELHIVTNVHVSESFSLDGALLPLQFFPVATGGQPVPIVMEFGGQMRDGKPVNINHVLMFQQTIFAGHILYYILTKTYFDPTLVDPQSAPA